MTTITETCCYECPICQTTREGEVEWWAVSNARMAWTRCWTCMTLSLWTKPEQAHIRYAVPSA